MNIEKIFIYFWLISFSVWLITSGIKSLNDENNENDENDEFTKKKIRIWDINNLLSGIILLFLLIFLFWSQF